jgi:hypothetical protein
VAQATSAKTPPAIRSHRVEFIIASGKSFEGPTADTIQFATGKPAAGINKGWKMGQGQGVSSMATAVSLVPLLAYLR